MAYALLAGRWVLALVFFSAGVAKLGSAASFSDAITRYGLRSGRLVDGLSTVIPKFEVLIAIALAVGILPEVGGLIAAGMLVTFAGAVAVSLLRGERFPCGCGLDQTKLTSWRLVVEDLALAALAAAVAFGPFALAAWPGAGPSSSLPAPSQALPIPLIVLLVAIIVRIVRTSGWPARAFRRLSSTLVGDMERSA